MRAIPSVLPPAANGTMTVTGLSGQSWAVAGNTAERMARTITEASLRANQHMKMALLGNAFLVEVLLVEETTVHRFERAVINPGRTAGVGWRDELFAAISVFVVAHDQVAAEEIDFLPVVVDK